MTLDTQITDTTKVYFYKQGYMKNPTMQTMTFKEACKELVAYGVFRNSLEAAECVSFQIKHQGRFKKASSAAGVNHPIVFLH